MVTSPPPPPAPRPPWGRRHRARRNALEATFDHGEEGYGLWLDPAVVDNPVYSEHWAGHRAVTVILEADSITIRRAGADPAAEASTKTSSASRRGSGAQRRRLGGPASLQGADRDRAHASVARL